MGAARPRAVCLGEAMVVLSPARPAPLAEVGEFVRSVGGAEANVAGGLAGLGIGTSWLSRLGADGFGRYVARDLAARGVDVGGVEFDPDRPTGLYVKDTGGGRTRMHYYRSGSAAAAMAPGFLDRPDVAARLAEAGLVHTSGITAGISGSAAAMLTRLVSAPRRGLVSIDLNWRPALWRDQDTSALVDLLRRADIVLLGADEAQAVLGTADPSELRELLGPVPAVVLKADAHRAISATPGGGTVEVPALAVDVVEPVGAGDAFAAGYLAGVLRGLPAGQRLRLGHLSAAAVLVVRTDHARPLDASVRQALLGCSEREWAAVRVRSDGVELPASITPPDTR